jgi:hypothetical protein
VPLTDITDFCLGWRFVPDDWYRDGTPNWAPGSAGIISETSATTPARSATVPAAFPGDTVQPESFALLSGVAPDEVSHIPPRMRYVIKEGYFVAWNNASIPAVVQPTARQVMFSASSATDLCTTAATSPFANGDVCSVSNNGNTLEGVSQTTRYVYVKVSDTTFKLMTEAGALVNITGTPTAGTVFTLSLISTNQRPANLPSGIAWYPMPCDLATADPQA